ncbi:MAG: hypothetical protein ACK5LH_04620 [Akkermansiaceae bacterium]|jgi:hypothetical protein
MTTVNRKYYPNPESKHNSSKQARRPKKLGEIYLNAKALGLNPKQARKLLIEKNALKLREQWNYRKLGLKIDEAREALAKASTCRSYHEEPECSDEAYDYCPRVKEHLVQMEIRKNKRDENLRLIESAEQAETLAAIQQLTNGYECGYKCKIALGDHWLVIQRFEHTVWSENKNRKWPLSSTTSYAATCISALGDILSYTGFDHRKGDWLGKIGDAIGLKTSERNAITMTSGMVPVRESNMLGVKITKMRMYGIGFPLYCASHADTHFHATSSREAVKGINRKIKAHQQSLLDDTEVVTLSKAKRMGFCQPGIDLFRSYYGLMGVRSVTAGQIRAAISESDVSSWHQELALLGILPKTSEL